MISRLPGKVLIAFVELLSKPWDLTCFIEADSGKLDIKRCKLGILFISLPIGSLIKLTIKT